MFSANVRRCRSLSRALCSARRRIVASCFFLSRLVRLLLYKLSAKVAFQIENLPMIVGVSSSACWDYPPLAAFLDIAGHAGLCVLSSFLPSEQLSALHPSA